MFVITSVSSERVTFVFGFHSICWYHVIFMCKQHVLRLFPTAQLSGVSFRSAISTIHTHLIEIKVQSYLMKIQNPNSTRIYSDWTWLTLYIPYAGKVMIILQLLRIIPAKVSSKGCGVVWLHSNPTPDSDASVFRLRLWTAAWRFTVPTAAPNSDSGAVDFSLPTPDFDSGDEIKFFRLRVRFSTPVPCLTRWKCRFYGAKTFGRH